MLDVLAKTKDEVQDEEPYRAEKLANAVWEKEQRTTLIRMLEYPGWLDKVRATLDPEGATARTVAEAVSGVGCNARAVG